jgi:hypothetical protein
MSTKQPTAQKLQMTADYENMILIIMQDGAKA